MPVPMPMPMPMAPATAPATAPAAAPASVATRESNSAAAAAKADAAADRDRPTNVGLHGLTKKQACGARLRVYYNEEGSSVPYGGICESIDVKRGLRVRLDGYSKREWVTDEDEWEWDEKHPIDPPRPRPVEFVIGPGPFRDTLARLTKSKELCATAAKGEHMPGPPPKAGAKRGAGGGRGAGEGGAKRGRKAQDKADDDGSAEPSDQAGAEKEKKTTARGQGAAARKRKAEAAALLAAAAAGAEITASEGKRAAIDGGAQPVSEPMNAVDAPTMQLSQPV